MVQNISDNPTGIPQGELLRPATELVPAPLDSMAPDDLSKETNIHGDPALDQADVVSTVNVQTWFNHTPWRITAGWSAIASLLATGILTSLFDWRSFLGWQTLVLTILLVDPLWGNVWRFAWGREGILPLGKMQQAYSFWLPYLRASSPAGRLMGIYQPTVAESAHTDGHEAATQKRSETDLAPLLFRTVVPTLLLTFGIAATLGSTALWLTGIVVICTLLGWLARQNWGKPAALLQALVIVALPWLLMTYLFQQSAAGSAVGTSFAVIGIENRAFYSLILAGLWTIHSWGIMQARRKPVTSISAHPLQSHAEQESGLVAFDDARDSTVSLFGSRIRKLFGAPTLLLLLAADVGILALLLTLREPLWLAILAPLWLPVWFAYLQDSPVDRQPIWRLLAMLVSAVAIGQTPLG